MDEILLRVLREVQSGTRVFQPESNEVAALEAFQSTALALLHAYGRGFILSCFAHPEKQTGRDFFDHVSVRGLTHKGAIALRDIDASEVLDPDDLPELPDASHQDLRKAAQRFRDGDLTGALSAACGAVDAATSQVYEEHHLGDPGKASFQERCKRAMTARGVVPELEEQLGALGWSHADITPFKKSFEGALNQGAYVMQTLRSQMGDVHGSKPILRSLVFDSVKWAQLIVGSLIARKNEG